MPISERIAKLATIPLRHGAHQHPDDGMCAVEAAAWIADEAFNDHPQCVCPVVAAFVRSWNDALPTDDDRDRLLKPYVPRIVGTRSTVVVEEQRAWMATDWIVREHTPAWLDLAGLSDHAALLRALPEITNAETARSAQPTIERATTGARAAWAAARDAAGAAVRDVLQPTVDALQQSAIDLLGALITAEVTA